MDRDRVQLPGIIRLVRTIGRFSDRELGQNRRLAALDDRRFRSHIDHVGADRERHGSGINGRDAAVECRARLFGMQRCGGRRLVGHGCVIGAAGGRNGNQAGDREAEQGDAGNVRFHDFSFGFSKFGQETGPQRSGRHQERSVNNSVIVRASSAETSGKACRSALVRSVPMCTSVCPFTSRSNNALPESRSRATTWTMTSTR